MNERPKREEETSHLKNRLLLHRPRLRRLIALVSKDRQDELRWGGVDGGARFLVQAGHLVASREGVEHTGG